MCDKKRMCVGQEQVIEAEQRGWKRGYDEGYRDAASRSEAYGGGKLSNRDSENLKQGLAPGRPSTEYGMPGNAADGTAPTVEHQFATGAKRSEVKPFYSAVPAESLRRLALRATGAPHGEVLRDRNGFEYSGGSRGYGYGNWRKGLPMRDTFNHVVEHLYAWKEAVELGQIPSDDDLAAAAWGIMFPLMTFEQLYRLGRGEDLSPTETIGAMLKHPTKDQ